MKRGFSPAATAAFATTLVVLAIIGWSIGWLAGGPDGQPQSGNQSESPAPIVVTPSPTPEPSKAPQTATTSPTPSPTFSLPEKTFEMPDLRGKEFMEAREQLLKLGVTVVVHFGESGQAGKVTRTLPVRQTIYWAGQKADLYVAGDRPKIKVPEIKGKVCDPEAKEILVRGHGFLIKEYLGERNHLVWQTSPPIGTEVDWGTQVTLRCTQTGASPSS
jgi:beta-lactam-binding protein with PASTA domain